MPTSSKKPLVIVTRQLPDAVETRMRELFDARLNVDDKPLTQAELTEAVKTAHVLVPTVTDRIDRALISQAGPQLKLIANFGTGVDNIDLDTARVRGIIVTNTPGVLTEDTADMTMALILAVPRRLAEGTALLKDPRRTWGGWSPTWMLGHRIYGKRLGIIGMGRIGQAVARRARAFGLQIHYHNRRRVADEIEQELEATYWDSLDQMLARMDIISVNCPHTPATYHLLSARRLKLLKPSAYIVNTARGEVIDENELARLIEAGQIAGAGLDVFEHEPAINPKLLASDRVVALPHMGSATLEGRIDMGEKVIINIKTFLDGHNPPDRVHPAMFYVGPLGTSASSGAEPGASGMKAAAELYHAFFTGLLLTLVTRRGARDAAEWVFHLFRHQHREKFLSSFDKLGLRGMPDAVACAAYHYLSNSIGGVSVEFMRETDRKAWINFVPPRWIYPGASICGIPSEVSRAFLRGWYAQNGVSLGNPRLGFVCTAQTTDGQHGLSGYFIEHDHELAPEERLQFRPGELPPPFDPQQAPRLPNEWTPERLAKAERNYAMEYIRSGLPRMVELFGPAEAAHLGGVTARLVGAQLYRQTAAALGVEPGSPQSFGQFMVRLAASEGDGAEATMEEGHAVLVRREGWRLMRGLDAVSPAVFDAWNGLLEGALAVHSRFCVLQVLSRADWGDEAFVWRIRRRPNQPYSG